MRAEPRWTSTNGSGEHCLELLPAVVLHAEDEDGGGEGAILVVVREAGGDLPADEPHPDLWDVVDSPGPGIEAAVQTVLGAASPLPASWSSLGSLTSPTQHGLVETLALIPQFSLRSHLMMILGLSQC